MPIEDEDEAASALRTFLDTKSMEKQVKERLDRYKRSLMRYIEENGTTDDDGHLWVQVGDFKPIKWENRKSTVLNRERAEEWAKQHGVLGKVTSRRIVVDFDEAAFLGVLYEQDVDADQFYDSTITPAFVPGRQT